MKGKIPPGLAKYLASKKAGNTPTMPTEGMETKRMMAKEAMMLPVSRNATILACTKPPMPPKKKGK